MTKQQDFCNQLQTILKDAEQIVGVIKDKELKPVAFGRIIDFLVNANEGVRIVQPKIKQEIIKSGKVKGGNKEGIKSWFEELVGEHFFQSPKNTSQILEKLEEQGHHLKNSDVQPYLKIFMKEKKLRRRKDKSGKKTVWHYSNW